jgi:hypothetical protein
MTQKEAEIAATIAQRTEYKRQGNEEGVKECDAKLERLGADPRPPQERATRLEREKARF